MTGWQSADALLRRQVIYLFCSLPVWAQKRLAKTLTELADVNERYEGKT